MLTNRNNIFNKRWRSLLAIATVLLVLGGTLSTAAQEPHTAGLVVRHGDGAIIYAVVQFEEESISGTELLERTGVDVVIAPFGGMGGAVCSLDGEGCESSNCFCKSYSSPSFFWRYYVLTDGTWSEQSLGPSSRDLRDGDIDGWSWTAGESGLPDVTIDDIVALNAPATPANEPDQTRTSDQPPSPAAGSESRAVVVAPGATPAVLAPDADAEGSANTYLAFAAMAALVVAVGIYAVILQRKAKR